MPRQKKVAKDTLSEVDKKYISLCLKHNNNVNYDELFKKLAAELSKDEQIIRDFADKVSVELKDEQLPPEPAPRELKPYQEMSRNLLTPNRLTESNKARHVSVMSEAASDLLEKTDSGPIKGSSRMKSCVFRQ